MGKSSHTKATRRFIKERRRNACPACLDRGVLTIDGYKRMESPRFGPCQVCEGKGYVIEIHFAGDEWRRYPWVIVE